MTRGSGVMQQRKGIFYTEPIEKHYLGDIMMEIFKVRIYDPFFVGRKDLTVIDAGSNVGIFSLYAHPYSKVIHALEPAQEHFDTLNHMLEYNGIENVKTHKLALSHQNGETTFYHTPNVTAYSLRPEIHVPEAGQETVQTIRLDDFFKQEGIEHVDFMKLDIEGSEFEVVGGEGFENVADKIDALVVELHAWPGINYQQIITRLNDLGFDLQQMATEATVFAGRRRK
jgi:FkbM family methyltransferase